MPFDKTSDGEWSLTIVDKKPGDVSSCVDTDADWGIPTGTGDPYPETLSCQLLEIAGVCKDGIFNLLVAESLGILSEVGLPFGATNETMSEACCVCGGGIPADDLSETLFEFRMVAGSLRKRRECHYS